MTNPTLNLTTARRSLIHVIKEKALRGVRQNFHDDPEIILRDAVAAAQAEYMRKVNIQRVLSRMTERLRQGYWCLGSTPIGYNRGYDKAKKRSLLVPDWYNSNVIRTALEKFASGEFQTRWDVMAFINSVGLKEMGADGQMKKKICSDKTIKTIFKNILFYSGFLEYEPWSIPRTKGQHEAIISLVTYRKVSDRLLTPGT